MSIRYERNFLRKENEQPLLLLPGDDDRARGNGFTKMHPSVPEIDGPIAAVVQALALRNWNVPGIDCSFRVLESGAEPVHQLTSVQGGVQGAKWAVHFYRPRYVFDGKNTYTEPSQVNIPGHELRLFEEGPLMYYPYVGEDWYEEEEAFQSREKYGARKNNQPRTYLLYELYNGAYRHQTDLGAEYDVIDEDRRIPVEQVHTLFTNFFEALQAKIEQTPQQTDDPYQAWQKAARIEAVPAPIGLPSFYVYTTSLGAPLPGKPVIGSGDRYLFPEELASQDDEVPYHPLYRPRPDPQIAKKFHYGFSLPPFQSQSGLWQSNPAHETTGIVKVKLKYANDVYVVDEKPMLAAKSYFESEAGDEDRPLTDEEQTCVRATLRKTMVPLSAYKNDYACPVFLIERPLYEDEAEYMTDRFRENIGGVDAMDQSYQTRLYRMMKAAL